MIIVVLILVILIGFIIFNPLKVDYNIETGEKKSSMPVFTVYCLICAGLIIYYTNIGGINFSEIIKNQNNEDNEEVVLPQETMQEEQPQPKPRTTKNSINFNSAVNVSRHIIPIRELAEYDGMSKKELFARRKTIVDSFSGLGGENYQPDEKILGNIQDGKPWWGTEGILCKGQGSHASDGKSRESSYFENPMILLNLELTRLMDGNRGLDNEYLISTKDLFKQYNKYDKNSVEGQVVRCFYDGKKPTKLFKQIAYIGHNWGKRSNDYIDFGELVDGLGIDRSTVDNASVSLKDLQNRLKEVDTTFVPNAAINSSAQISVSQLFVILGGTYNKASALLKIADLGSNAAGGNASMPDCGGLWPLPTDVIVYPKTKKIEVSYNLSGFMKEFEGTDFYYSVNKTDWFGFGSINARDFGYEYAHAYDTNGIRFANTPNASTGAPLVNYWCLGHSCQIEGGCNNICPANNAFTFFVDKYPAYAKFKLYKKQPAQGEEPDAYFEVYLN